MTNREFAVAANKFFYFANNFTNEVITYPTLFNGEVKEVLPAFFSAFDKHLVAHLKGKWESAYERSGRYGAVIDFFGELDGKNRAKFLAWANENYILSDGFGLNLEVIKD